MLVPLFGAGQPWPGHTGVTRGRRSCRGCRSASWRMECMRRNARGRRPPRFEGASICLSGLSPSPVGRHALIGYPQVFRGGAGLIEDINGDPSARIPVAADAETRSEEHTSALQSLMRITYAVLCMKKKK